MDFFVYCRNAFWDTWKLHIFWLRNFYFGRYQWLNILYPPKPQMTMQHSSNVIFVWYISREIMFWYFFHGKGVILGTWKKYIYFYFENYNLMLDAFIGVFLIHLLNKSPKRHCNIFRTLMGYRIYKFCNIMVTY